VAIVRATCPTCGDVDISSADVQLQVCTSTNVAAYSFRCPLCKVMVNRTTTDRVVEALTQVGVRTVRWGLPAELSEPKLGPPINLDDLLSFHLAMRDGGWEQELAGLRRRP
jgi:predicted RNA-binding Zn-ribbon protein involved in translation (DUF1610 family)